MKSFTLFAVILAFLCLACFAQDWGIFDSESFSSSETDPFNGSNSFSESRRKAAKLLIEANHNTSRYVYFSNNKTLREVPHVFCLPKQVTLDVQPWTNLTGPQNISDCQWPMYAESVLFIPGIAVIVAVLIWPIGQMLVSCIRGCACGMCRPRKGCCCCGESADDFSAADDGYSDCSRALTFVFSIIVCIVLLVGLIVGLMGHVEVTDSLNSLIDYVTTMVGTFVDILNSTVVVINQTATDFNEYVDFDLVNISKQALNWTDKLYDGIDTVNYYLNKADSPRQTIMYVSLTAPLICALLVLLSCALCSACSCFMIAFGFILTFLALVIFSVNYPISYALSDGCVYLENAMNKSHPEYVDTVALLFDCDENSTISNFSNSVKYKIENITSSVCTVVDKLTQIRNIPCDKNHDGTITPSDRCPMFDPPEDVGPCTVDTMEEYLDYTFHTYKLGCFVPTLIPLTYTLQGDCGDPRIHDSYEKGSCEALYPGMNAISMACDGAPNYSFKINDPENFENVTDPNIKGNATLLMRITKVQLRLLDVYREKIRPFLKCESITEILYYGKDFACVSLILGTTPIFAGEMIIAVGTLVGTVVAMLAIKRFNKKYLLTRARKIADREMVNLVS